MPARVRSLKIGFTFGGTALAAQQADAAILSAESGADGRIRTGDPLFTNQDYAVRQVPLRVNKCRLVVTSLVVFWWYASSAQKRSLKAMSGSPLERRTRSAGLSRRHQV